MAWCFVRLKKTMIEVAASQIDASERLLEALERSRLPAGEGKASTERAPVPHALAEEFRVLMEQPLAEVNNPTPIQASVAAQSSDAQRLVQNTPNDPITPVSGLKANEATQLLTPDALLAWQFEVRMTVLESKLFYKVQNQATNDLDQRLRSQEG